MGYHPRTQPDQPGADDDSRGSGSLQWRVRHGPFALTIAGVTQYGIGVAEFLRSYLRTNKIIPLGWSWGSVIGVRMVRKRTRKVIDERSGSLRPVRRLIQSKPILALNERGLRYTRAILLPSWKSPGLHCSLLVIRSAMPGVTSPAS